MDQGKSLGKYEDYMWTVGKFILKALFLTIAVVTGALILRAMIKEKKKKP